MRSEVREVRIISDVCFPVYSVEYDVALTCFECLSFRAVWMINCTCHHRYLRCINMGAGFLCLMQLNLLFKINGMITSSFYICIG